MNERDSEGMEGFAPGLQDLEKRRIDAKRELDDARNRISELQRHAADAEERVRLIEKLIALEAGTGSQSSSSDELLRACEDIITAAGQPVGLRDLRNALLARGVPLPGQGLDANLIARINRSDGRVVRVKRGLYDVPDGAGSEKPRS